MEKSRRRNHGKIKNSSCNTRSKSKANTTSIFSKMESLPIEILENIISRVPFELTLQCIRVSKTWRTIVLFDNVGLLFTFERATPRRRSTKNHVTQLYYGDPRYEAKIENYYSEDTLIPLGRVVGTLRPYGMVGSCNGLVCCKAVDPIHFDDGLAFVCCNPITGEVVCIPGLQKYGPSLKPPVGGFGYVDSTNEYKVVRIYHRYWGAHVQVYTLGSGRGWRDKGDVGFLFSANMSGIFANGALHWINLRENHEKISAFGLADEEFRHIPFPPAYHGDWSDSELMLLGGNLCVVRYQDHRLDIWAFKSREVTNDANASTSYGNTNKKRREYYYDHTWSWSEDFSISWEGEVLYTPFVITHRNTLLLWRNGTSNLWCYDPETSTLQKYWVAPNHKFYIQAIPHMNTLVSLKDLGEELCNDGKTFNIKPYTCRR